MAGSVHKKKLLEIRSNAIQTQTSDNDGESMNIMEDNVFEMNVPKSEIISNHTRGKNRLSIHPISFKNIRDIYP